MNIIQEGELIVPEPMRTSEQSQTLAEILDAIGQSPACRTTAYSDGDVMIFEGSASTPLLIIDSGRVEITTASGSQLALDSPTVIGEQSLLTGRATNATVRAIGHVHGRELAPAAFWELVKVHSVGQDIIQGLSRLMGDRLRDRFHDSPYVALVAHDGRKDDLIAVVSEFRDYLCKQPLLSTKHTGERVQQDVGLNVARIVHSGPTGGDQEVGTLVVEGLVRAVLFFPDPLTAQPHFMDVGALQRVCDVCNVPMASNRGSGLHLLRSLSQGMD